MKHNISVCLFVLTLPVYGIARRGKYQNKIRIMCTTLIYHRVDTPTANIYDRKTISSDEG